MRKLAEIETSCSRVPPPPALELRAAIRYWPMGLPANGKIVSNLISIHEQPICDQAEMFRGKFLRALKMDRAPPCQPQD
jgi:hypothetical protein